MKGRIFFCLSMVALSACASGSNTPAGAAASPVASAGSDSAAAAMPAASGARRNPNVITASELADPSFATTDAYTAIQRLRPSFFTARGTANLAGDGTSVMTSINNQIPTSSTMLKSIQASEVKEVRFLSASEAAQKFGIKAGNGPVIMVTRK